ncbi:MAG TPA: RDD family protein, partial [Solirubrobacteraceae bacterium]|nr:RDD family protein [Solirubrobacteraceae bacterium]
MSGVRPEVRTAQAQATEARRRRQTSSVSTAVQAPPTGGRAYSGLVTRALAFALDSAIVNGCALVVGVVVGLGLSILHLPEAADVVIAAILGGLWVLWTVGYFAFFWSTTGQTPGDRVMQFRVVTEDGAKLKPRRALVRVAGSFLAALPLFAGFLLILFDDKRRGFQDRLAGTVVIEAPKTSYIAARRDAKRAAN